LDTGADINVIAESTLKNLDHLRRYPWNRGPIHALGDSFTPTEGVRFGWRLRGKGEFYEDDFAIIHESRASSFDILLSRGFIEKHGLIYKSHKIISFVSLASGGAFQHSVESMVLSGSAASDG
jgi:hypothetical protein